MGGKSLHFILARYDYSFPTHRLKAFLLPLFYFSNGRFFSHFSQILFFTRIDITFQGRRKTISKTHQKQYLFTFFSVWTTNLICLWRARRIYIIEAHLNGQHVRAIIIVVVVIDAAGRSFVYTKTCCQARNKLECFTCFTTATHAVGALFYSCNFHRFSKAERLLVAHLHPCCRSRLLPPLSLSLSVSISFSLSLSASIHLWKRNVAFLRNM